MGNEHKNMREPAQIMENVTCLRNPENKITFYKSRSLQNTPTSLSNVIQDLKFLVKGIFFMNQIVLMIFLD